LAAIREEAYPYVSPMPFPEIWKLGLALLSLPAPAKGTVTFVCRMTSKASALGESIRTTSYDLRLLARHVRAEEAASAGTVWAALFDRHGLTGTA
jgi:hypothetical protein